MSSRSSLVSVHWLSLFFSFSIDPFLTQHLVDLFHQMFITLLRQHLLQPPFQNLFCSFPFLLSYWPSGEVGGNPCVSCSVFALTSNVSVRFVSRVQLSCSQPSSSSSPSFNVLAGQKHCLIRHWGRWPQPIFFCCKTSQSLCSTPPLVRRSGLSPKSFFGFSSTPVKKTLRVAGVRALNYLKMSHFTSAMYHLVHFSSQN